jgi:hypothetical protein
MALLHPGGQPPAPSEIVNVRDAGLQTETAGGRHLVRGVSSKENPAVAIVLGNMRRGRPGCNAQNRHGEIGYADRDANQLDRTVGREIGGCVAIRPTGC